MTTCFNALSRDLSPYSFSLLQIAAQDSASAGTGYTDAFDFPDFEAETPVADDAQTSSRLPHNITKLASAARLAATIGTREGLERWVAPGTVTSLIVADDDQNDAPGIIAGHFRKWLRHIGIDCQMEPAVIAHAHTVFARRNPKADREALEHALSVPLERSRPAILLVSAEAELPVSTHKLVSQNATLTPLSASMVAALLKITHRTRLSKADRARLGTAALETLTGNMLSVAFAHETAREVVNILLTMTEPAPRITPKRTLANIHGLGEAAPALQRMVRDLKRWQTGGLDWSKVISSAVLFGAHGNGKSLAAEALAGSAGVPLLKTSYTDAQATGTMSDTLSAMRAAFKEAEAAAPCVFLIEEIDGFSARSVGDRNSSYMLAIITELLQLLDRAAQVPSLIVLANTNCPDAVDPAILRSGRFDLHLPVLPPERRDNMAILRDNLSGADLALEDAADRLLGKSGADIAMIGRLTLSLARDEERPVSDQDLPAAVDQIAPPLDKAIMRRIAVHEAGHLLVGHILGLPLPKQVYVNAASGAVVFPQSPFQTFATASDQIITLMAGRAAEIMVFGEASNGAGLGQDSDLAQATALALKLDTEWGLGDCGPVYLPLPNVSLAPGWLKDKLRETQREAEQTALQILHDHRLALHHIAETLLRKRSLEGHAIQKLLKQCLTSSKPNASSARENVIRFPGPDQR